MPRPSRPTPRELVDGWPDAASTDPVGEVARQFTANLRAAIGDRTLRAAAEAAGGRPQHDIGDSAGPDLARPVHGGETRAWPRSKPLAGPRVGSAIGSPSPATKAVRTSHLARRVSRTSRPAHLAPSTPHRAPSHPRPST
ncbi:hypothetical protein [Mycetocola zhadangensis]|uniref:hypothetical protein n=1 Tax=Mycetocola zhadangensis TaxID=1164595 RepID=UPI0011C453CF|nr:hypothetical protein [Mycetocola zhadangensis]